MFCPQCSSAYSEGVAECPDCGVELVEELPPKPEGENPWKARLKTAALLAIIAFSVKFILRTVWTFDLGIGGITPLFQAVYVISFLASAAILYFFIVLYYGYGEEDQKGLKVASGLAVIGSVIVLLVSLKYLMIMFHRYLPPLFMSTLAGSHYIDGFAPLLSSLLTLAFFTLFWGEMRTSGNSKLAKASLWAAIGAAAGLLLPVSACVGYIAFGEPWRAAELARKLLPAALTIAAFSFYTLLYFMAELYREVGRK